MSENLNLQEIEKFETLSDTWWDIQGPAKPLHILNPCRVQFITDRVFIRKLKILDIGCGAGILSESLAKRGAEVIGLDAAPKLIAAAIKHAEENNISEPSLRYECTTLESYATIHPESVDIVTCMELLEHVPDPQSLLKAASTVVKPGGHLFFSTINRNLKAYLYAIIGAEYLLKLLPKHTHDYAQFIRPRELAEMLRVAGLKVQEIAGIHYHPFLDYASVTKDPSVNYLLYARKETLA